MSLDAPDWQRVVTTVTSTGAVPDAPDWEHIVVGPGGTPVGGGGGGDGQLSTSWGFAAWTFPMYAATSVQTLGNGGVFFTALPVGTAATVTHVSFYVSTNATSLKANQNYVGIYQLATSGGNAGKLVLVGSTAAGVCDTAFASVGGHAVAFSASIALAASQYYYLAYLCNPSGASLQLVALGSATTSAKIPNFAVPFTPGGYPFPGLYIFTTESATTFTTLPSPFNQSGQFNGTVAPWGAVY